MVFRPVFLRVSRCFFFQAEDGIRDGTVTGVQTCALPIWLPSGNTTTRITPRAQATGKLSRKSSNARAISNRQWSSAQRSEERRVGKECRSRWSLYYEKKKRLTIIIARAENKEKWYAQVSC